MGQRVGKASQGRLLGTGVSGVVGATFRFSRWLLPAEGMTQWGSSGRGSPSCVWKVAGHRAAETAEKPGSVAVEEELERVRGTVMLCSVTIRVQLP